MAWPRHGQIDSGLACRRSLSMCDWQGLHAFDVIWTLFMFMVGVSLTFSLAKRKRMHESHGAIYSHAVKRAVIMFILGMIAQGNLLEFNLATLHPFYSVLHGIAAGYLIATIVTLNFNAEGARRSPRQSSWSAIGFCC